MRRSTSSPTAHLHRSAHPHRSVRRSFNARVRAWAAHPERGDVPGWVLITIMTAGLVAALWLVAEPLLTGLFSSAVSSVGT